MKKENNPEEIEKIEKYMKSKEDIFNFVLSRRVLKSIIYYFGLISVVLFFGGRSYIDYEVKITVEKVISGEVKEEVNYLRKVNDISRLAAKATASGEVTFYGSSPV